VFGKAGRAETATDPAPLEMFETTIQLKPRDQWRPGMTPEKLSMMLTAHCQSAGASRTSGAADPQPHRYARDWNQDPVGVKVAGTDLREIDRIAAEIERAVRKCRA